MVLQQLWHHGHLGAFFLTSAVMLVFEQVREPLLWTSPMCKIGESECTSGFHTGLVLRSLAALSEHPLLGYSLLKGNGPVFVPYAGLRPTLVTVALLGRQMCLGSNYVLQDLCTLSMAWRSPVLPQIIITDQNYHNNVKYEPLLFCYFSTLVWAYPKLI